jgi:hypothetical protein
MRRRPTARHDRTGPLAGEPRVQAGAAQPAIGRPRRVAEDALEPEAAAQRDRPRPGVELVRDQRDPLGAQAVERPRRERLHALGGVPLADLAGADPVADLGLGQGPVRAVQPHRGDQATRTALEREVGEVRAQEEVPLRLAAARLGGLERRLLGDPRQEPEVLAQRPDRLDERLVQLRRVGDRERPQEQARRLERGGHGEAEGVGHGWSFSIASEIRRSSAFSAVWRGPDATDGPTLRSDAPPRNTGRRWPPPSGR